MAFAMPFAICLPPVLPSPDASFCHRLAAPSAPTCDFLSLMACAFCRSLVTRAVRVSVGCVLEELQEDAAVRAPPGERQLRDRGELRWVLREQAATLPRCHQHQAVRTVLLGVEVRGVCHVVAHVPRHPGVGLFGHRPLFVQLDSAVLPDARRRALDRRQGLHASMCVRETGRPTLAVFRMAGQHPEQNEFVRDLWRARLFVI
jgi:hypothetical protein